MFNRIKTVAVRFANDEQGDAVQNVMGIAVAGMICLLIMKITGVDATGASTSGGIGQGILDLGAKIIGTKFSVGN